jgi:hypothetical protein
MLSNIYQSDWLIRTTWCNRITFHHETCYPITPCYSKTPTSGNIIISKNSCFQKTLSDFMFLLYIFYPLITSSSRITCYIRYHHVVLFLILENLIHCNIAQEILILYDDYRYCNNFLIVNCTGAVCRKCSLKISIKFIFIKILISSWFLMVSVLFFKGAFSRKK